MKYFSLQRSRSDSFPPTKVTQDPSPPVTTCELAPQRQTYTPRKVKSSPKLGQPTASIAELPPPMPPTAPDGSKGAHRISKFASKLRFLKVRRTKSESSSLSTLPSTANELSAPDPSPAFMVDAQPEPLALHHPLNLSSKPHKASKATASPQAHTKQRRLNTPATTIRLAGKIAPVVLENVELRLDEKDRHASSSTVLSPRTRDMGRSRSSSGLSSIEDYGGPRTPTDLITSLHGSNDPFARVSIDEAGSQEVISVLGSLFPSQDDDVAELPRQSLDASIAEGSSPILRPVDYSSAIHPIEHRRKSPSDVKGTPVAHQSLPTRSSSLRGRKLGSRTTALPIAEEN